MRTLIEYELTKIFQSKIIIWCLAIFIIGIFGFSAYLTGQYRNGVAGEYTLSDMQGTKLRPTFVSSSNIEEYRNKLQEFEADDSIYVSDKDGTSDHPYYGKYEEEYLNSGFPVTGDIMGEEDNKSDKMVIKKEVLPEYLSLYIPVHTYELMVSGIESNRNDAEQSTTLKEKLLRTYYADEAEKAVNEGFTVGYDYGWENIFFTLSMASGIVLGAVIILGLCNVFTVEYTTGADSLLLTSKKGKGRVVASKIIASLIYALIFYFVYMILTVGINFIILGPQGATVGVGQSNIVKFFSVAPFILLGCILLALITLAISAVISKPITSIALSSIIGFFPLLLSEYMLSTPNFIMPINMIFGNYIASTQFICYNGSLYDLRILFLIVAVILLIVCTPTIFIAYCKRQVKN